MTDIEVVRMLSGNNDISDEFVAFQLTRTKELLLTYLNVPELPDGLHSIYLEIAAFKLNANAKGGSANLGGGSKDVASVSDGNQSVSYSSRSASSIDWNNDAAILQAYADILGRYRRMVVNKPVCGHHLGARCLNGRKNKW